GRARASARALGRGRRTRRASIYLRGRRAGVEESAMHGLRAVGIGLVVVALLGCAAPGGQGAAPRADAGVAPAAAGAAAPPPAAAPQEKITFALPAVSGVFAPHILADQKGFFREEGFAVDMPVTRSNLIPPGLAAGEIDYA